MEYFFVFSALPLELGSFSVLVTRVCAMPVFFTLSLFLWFSFSTCTRKHSWYKCCTYQKKQLAKLPIWFFNRSIWTVFLSFFYGFFFSKNFLFSLLYQNVMLLFSLFFRCDVFCSHAQNMWHENLINTFVVSVIWLSATRIWFKMKWILLWFANRRKLTKLCK